MRVSEILHATDISVRYRPLGSRLRRSRSREVHALERVSVTVRQAGILGIAGESGAGKSTLAKVLAGVIAPHEGTVRYEGAPIGCPRKRHEARLIQMVAQDPGSSLNPALTVRTVLSELIRFHGLRPADGVEVRCYELMDLVGLPRAVLAARPRALSGGERQRVALARALAVEPAVLIADEVLSALDTPVQAEILNLLRDLRERLSVAIVLIAHDLAVISSICEEILVMHRGSVVERGATRQIFTQPADPYTRMLLEAARRLTMPLAGG